MFWLDTLDMLLLIRPNEEVNVGVCATVFKFLRFHPFRHNTVPEFYTKMWSAAFSKISVLGLRKHRSRVDAGRKCSKSNLRLETANLFLFLWIRVWCKCMTSSVNASWPWIIVCIPPRVILLQNFTALYILWKLNFCFKTNKHLISSR